MAVMHREEQEAKDRLEWEERSAGTVSITLDIEEASEHALFDKRRIHLAHFAPIAAAAGPLVSMADKEGRATTDVQTARQMVQKWNGAESVKTDIVISGS